LVYRISISEGKMFIREVRSKNKVLPTSSKITRIQYDNNSLHVEMARPDYLGLLNIEYQYRMEGASDEWSAWTKNNHYDLSFLPAGRYTLFVRSRDIFGRMQESEPFTFSIVPPYWQTAWFSAMEILFFSLLVFGSARLNRKQIHSRRVTVITNVLTIVTIVLIIELLQNAAASYFGDMDSPVLAFAIDVVVALFVFPVELLLKRIVKGKRNVVVAKPAK
ncbi:MAG: hypothetical protein OEY56_10870, partial [Cyclobacteriaceae bacterium]|nr:hypothetical protein [Cyclobacteriaceae bacterium]